MDRTALLCAVVVMAVLLTGCSAVGLGDSNAPTETPIPTATPTPTIEDLIADALLPSEILGQGWSVIPPDPRVARAIGDETSLLHPCSIGVRVVVEHVRGQHLAGKRFPSEQARPQWYETIALFDSPGAAIDYLQDVRRTCILGGSWQQGTFPDVGSGALYLTYHQDDPFQSHHLVLIRRANAIMQIKVDDYQTAADPAIWRSILMSADAEFVQLLKQLAVVQPST